MAAEREAEKDIRAHRSSYGLFVGMMKWGTAVSVIVALLVVLIIAN